MSFHEVQFPPAISYGSSGGPGFNTAVLETDGGQEQRIARLSQPRHRYNVAYGIKTYADLLTLKEFYIARLGPASGFRYKDWLDFTTASDHRSSPSVIDVVLGVGDGTTSQFQLIKKYTSGPTTVTRTLEKPVSGTTVVSLDDALQESGWSVNTTTGLITFDNPVASDVVVKAGCVFDVPVRFGLEIDDVLNESLDFFDAGSLAEIPLVELVNEDPQTGEFFFGGASHSAPDEDLTLTALEERLQVYDPQSANLKIILPDPTSLSLGGPYFILVNESGANAMLVRDDGDTTTLATLAASGELQVWLGVDSGSSPMWYFT